MTLAAPDNGATMKRGKCKEGIIRINHLAASYGELTLVLRDWEKIIS
jgi:hypothetical protein